MSQIIEDIEKKQQKENFTTDVRVGDTVIVHSRISEGKKTRIQRFQGLIIKSTGTRNRQSITLRKIVDSIGVEKTFLLHSPLLEKLEVVTKGKGRQARLNYLRNRLGKAALRVKKLDG